MNDFYLQLGAYIEAGNIAFEQLKEFMLSQKTLNESLISNEMELRRRIHELEKKKEEK